MTRRASPAWVPTRAQVARESALPQRDKDGCEIDQGLLVSAVLADPAAGAHLCHAMLHAAPWSAERAQKLARDGTLELGTASVERRGKAVHVTMRNPRFLNAEDEGTLDDLESAVDVATSIPRARSPCCAAARSSENGAAAASSTPVST